MKFKLLRTFSLLLMSIALLSSGCSDNPVETTRKPTQNEDTTGGNFSPSFELTWRGSVIKSESFLADYGEKIYVTGLDQHSNLLFDFAFPAKKGELLTDAPFSFEDKAGHTKGIFYIGSDQWAISQGKVSIIKHVNNRIEGSFSGKAYMYDYATGMAKAIDSTVVQNGKFKDIYVKG